MDIIQTDVSDAALVTAIRANLSGFFHHLARSLPNGGLESERFTRWHTSIHYPWFNGVLSAHAPQEQDGSFVEETIQFFRERKVGTFTWWMEPHVSCKEWEPFLSRHGFGFSNDTPGMAVDLQLLNQPAQTVDGLEICVVTSEEALRDWAQVFTFGYGLPMEWESQVYDLASSLGVDLPVRNYVGYLNARPVATSCLFLGGRSAGIYSVATLPEARGRGIGAALTLRPLAEARGMGYRIGVLQSSEMGYSAYKKLGFRHLCQIEYFYLSLT
jgi:ribosomal protein S18 acetylase RimI-like enzyme